MNIFLSDFLNYVKTLRNMLENLTLDQFRPHHWIKEESPVKGVSNTVSKVNVNNVKIWSSSKNNKYLNSNKSVNRFRRATLRIPTMTNRMSCFLCGKKDHYIWECKFLKNKMDEDGNANEAIVIKDIIAMVSDVCNKDHYISYGCNYKSFWLVFWFRCNVACVHLQGIIQDLGGVFHSTRGACGHPQ